MPEEPVEALVAGNEEAGADPHPTTAGTRWPRERDMPEDVLFRALEATAPG